MRRGFVNMQRGLVGCLVLALTAGPLPAREPSNLADLAYQDSKWAQSELRKRGYTLTNKDHHAGAFFQYWWNANKHQCVQVKHTDGEVAEVDSTSGTDCGQYHSEATDNDDGAAVAIAAAAIIGAAALAHNSHHRDGKHGDDSKSVSEFDRGYRDGLYRNDYHNYNDTEAYSDGYSAGVDDRSERSSHKSHHHHGHHSGYRSYVSVDDLYDARASSADSELRARGFSDTGGYKRHGTSFVTWWNQDTRQCIEIGTSNGRVKSIESISAGSCQ